MFYTKHVEVRLYSPATQTTPASPSRRRPASQADSSPSLFDFKQDYLLYYPISAKYLYLASHLDNPMNADVKRELANVLTHGPALILFVAAVPFLVAKAAIRGNDLHTFAVVLYGFSLIMVFASSTAYHSILKPGIKKVLRTVDHISIYFLIVGSYTPFVAICVNNTAGYRLLMILWVMVGLGIVFKIFFVSRFKFMSTAVYVAMGGMALTLGKDLGQIPDLSLKWVIGGGLSYLIGVFFYLNNKIPYHHAIWHIFVFGGSVGIYMGVYHMLTLAH